MTTRLPLSAREKPLSWPRPRLRRVIIGLSISPRKQGPQTKEQRTKADQCVETQASKTRWVFFDCREVNIGLDPDTAKHMALLVVKTGLEGTSN
jgi:hypothetical protein